MKITNNESQFYCLKVDGKNLVLTPGNSVEISQKMFEEMKRSELIAKKINSGAFSVELSTNNVADLEAIVVEEQESDDKSDDVEPKKKRGRKKKD